MNASGIEVLLVNLVMSRRVVTATEVHELRPVCLVRVVIGDVVGWGECGALAAPTTVDPDVRAVHRALVDEVVPRLCRQWQRTGMPSSREIIEASEVVADPSVEDHGHATGVPDLILRGAIGRMCAATIEMALLDAALKAESLSLARWLGVERHAVEIGGVVGIPPARDRVALLDDVARVVAGGMRRVRLKIAPGWDLEPVRAVREHFGDLVLQVDANGAYRFTDDPGAPMDARRLVMLDDLEIACVEQPLSPDDLAGHRRLAACLRTPVALDESLRSLEALERALSSGACRIACVKPARLGGLAAARAASELCGRFGVEAFVGGFFETGLGRCANAALCGLPSFGLPGDLSDPATYLEENPFSYLPMHEGMVTFLDAPGLGARPRSEVLRRCTVSRVWFSVH